MEWNTRHLLSSLLILAASLIAVTVVLADYLGPDRATTTVVWRRLSCEYLAEHDESGPGGYYACTLTLYRTPSSGCPSTGSVDGYFTSAACGWPKGCSGPGSWSCDISGSSSTEGCSEGESGCEGSTQTVNQPPATISGSISCGTPGSNGWCCSAASLNLSGSEPLSGYSITALEGTRNSVTFGCSGSSCSVDLLEGRTISPTGRCPHGATAPRWAHPAAKWTRNPHPSLERSPAQQEATAGTSPM